MAEIYRFRVGLSGWIGAPGLNTFYAATDSGAPADIQAVADFDEALRLLYDGLRLYRIPSIIATGPADVDIVDVATGQLLGRVGGLPNWNEPGSDPSSPSSRATMAKFRYRTDELAGGRFIAGGIFYGPISDAAIDTNGTLSTEFRSIVPLVHEGLARGNTGLHLVVWHHPTRLAPASGQAGEITSVSVMPQPAVLRSRRD